MPTVFVNDIYLYYEEAGRGFPILFVHEFGGDWRSWEPQVRFFSSRYRAITFSARGYLPSDVPDSPAAYSQDWQVEDVKGLLDALRIDRAHICGLSMGSYTTLLFGLKYPDRSCSLAIAGSGYGSGKSRQEFHQRVAEMADQMLKDGMKAISQAYTQGPARVQFQNKNPRGWEEFRQQFEEHSPKGSAYTFLGVQRQRPSVTDLGKQLKNMSLPVLIMLGDEDELGIEGSLFMKRNIPRAGLEIFPRSGHTLNLEEPERFNSSLLNFITAVDAGRWEARDPRSLVGLM
ncbi:MAG: alpha/beta hydrolase [Deltaproteobacteria bacterium]|nr:alpha/beta hydrolase [Deltaproteobacteria bacterium]